MITLTLIILVIIFIIGYNKKDKRPSNADAQIGQLPPIHLRARTDGTAGRLWTGELLESDSNILKEFRHNNGIITLILKTDIGLQAPLKDLIVRAEKSTNIYISVTYEGQKITFVKIGNFTSDEWDTIISVLSLAGTTYGMDIFGSTYKNISRAATIVKIISKL